MPTVAIADDFLEAYSRLPKKIQKKVRTFTEKFRTDPKSAAINYEKIYGTRDDKVRTVRIDQQYRAIVLHPEQGDVHVLTWVDNHDEAMDWAANKVFNINPVTGALQVINVEVGQPLAERTRLKEAQPAGLFTDHDDDVLTSFGAPTILLPAIRGIQSQEQLSELGKHLPAEVHDALSYLAGGIPAEEICATVAQAHVAAEVDTGDFAAALQQADSRRRFVTITSAGELASILDAPLARWRVFLHPSQKDLVSRGFNGPAQVLGGAGTGKTVVAMHRARHLSTEVFGGLDNRILFTTFTANLAHNVRRNLKTLCGDELQRIEVTHLHAWASRLLHGIGHHFKVVTDQELHGIWEHAALATEVLDWDPGFLRQEWNDVVRGNGITTLEDYLKVSRTDRGVALSRPDRARVWKVFEDVQQRLHTADKREWLDVICDAREHLQKHPEAASYCSVIVDEAQDFHPEEWRLIRSLVPPGANDLFIVGDTHQRIYGQKVRLEQCGIDTTGRSARLHINYRTTEEIRRWATEMLTGIEFDDLNGLLDQDSQYRSLLSGPRPEVHVFPTQDGETEFLRSTIPVLLKMHQPEEICMVARTGKLVANYEQLLEGLGTPHVVLDKDTDEQAPGVRLATMHRVKGLEFPCMVLVAVNARVMPIAVKSIAGDRTAQEEHANRERSLLFVAATRARDRVVVSAWGEPSPLLADVFGK